MRILFCIQASALHAARWINQLADTGWELDIFENIPPGHGVCPELRCGRVHVAYPRGLPAGVDGESVLKSSWPCRLLIAMGRLPGNALVTGAADSHLERILRVSPPDCIHLLGLGVNWLDQSATLMRVRERLGGGLPCPLVYSSWGTDLEVFASDPANRDAARHFLSAVDCLITECERDHRLAVEFGFRGKFLGRFPAFGGTDVEKHRVCRLPGPSSGRRAIVLKGRDASGAKGDPIGRAMTALRAMGECADELRGYRVAVLQATPQIEEEARVLGVSRGLDIRIMPRMSYEHLLRLMGSARIVMSMTVNDGLPSILVEAMAMGALPVHSDLEPVREWVTDGVNGLLVPAEDVSATAVALRRALKDDALVDRAAETNERLVREKLDYSDVRRRAIEMYERVAGKISRGGAEDAEKRRERRREPESYGFHAQASMDGGCERQAG